MNSDLYEKEYPLQKETYSLIGIAMEVHRHLGKGFAEIVYKDALEYELKRRNILFEREKNYVVRYKEVVLPHEFFADFVVSENIILEVKCTTKVIDAHYAQVINYLAVSKLEVGLILNFANDSLEYKRVIKSNKKYLQL